MTLPAVEKRRSESTEPEGQLNVILAIEETSGCLDVASEPKFRHSVQILKLDIDIFCLRDTSYIQKS